MVVWCTQNLRQDGSSFMWHQPCQRCKVPHFGGYSKKHYKKLVTHVESHASAVSLLESGEQRYIKAIIIIIVIITLTLLPVREDLEHHLHCNLCENL